MCPGCNIRSSLFPTILVVLCYYIRNKSGTLRPAYATGCTVWHGSCITRSFYPRVALPYQITQEPWTNQEHLTKLWGLEHSSCLSLVCSCLTGNYFQNRVILGTMFCDYLVNLSHRQPAPSWPRQGVACKPSGLAVRPAYRVTLTGWLLIRSVNYSFRDYVPLRGIPR
jgi:hypothetical protein